MSKRRDIGGTLNRFVGSLALDDCWFSARQNGRIERAMLIQPLMFISQAGDSNRSLVTLKTLSITAGN